MKEAKLSPPQKDDKKKKKKERYMTEFMYSTRKWKPAYSSRKQKSGCPGNRGWEGEIIET